MFSNPPHLFSQSHLPIELEQGTLGLNAIRSTNEILPDTASVTVNAVHSTDSQMIPSHLKCGMWASLALATVFLAGLYASSFSCPFSPLTLLLHFNHGLQIDLL